MADPPPEDPPGHRPSTNESLQPAITELPHPIPSDSLRSPIAVAPSGHLQSEMPNSGLDGDSSDPPQSANSFCRPPLAELQFNGGAAGENLPGGEVVFSAKAVFKKPSSARTPVAPSHRKFKKMKTAASKSHPDQDLPNEDGVQQNSKDFVLDARVCLPSDAGTPAVITPLQTVDAEDVSLSDGDDYACSDFEEDEDDFDFEAFYVDEKKRAELCSLMENYGVYDEEQLRLAIRRERKQQKLPLLLAGIPSRSPDSAPASPTRIPSRFIPPITHDPLPLFEGSNPAISARESTFHTRLDVTSVDSIPMLHTPMQPSHAPHIHATLPCTIPMQPTTMHHSPMHSTPMQPTPMQPTPMHQTSMQHNPMHPTPLPHSPIQLNPNSMQTPHQPATLTSHRDPNPLASGDLTDFPPLPNGSTEHVNGGNGDTVMAPVNEGAPRPTNDTQQVSSSTPIEHTRRSTAAPAPRPPTSFAERVKNSAPPTAPVAFNPTKFTPIRARGDREGTPVISFTKTDTDCLAGRVGLAVVGKFSHSIPSSHNIDKALNNIPIKGTLKWNFLNAKHVLIMLSDVEDYAKLLHGVNGLPVWYVESIPMRVFKWTPEFDPSFETPIVAVWCNLPALPIHLYDQRALYMICSSLGNPIQVDYATASRSRISFARVCVEIDITKPPVEEFVIDMAGTEVRQKVVWDKIPRYCADCKHVGHLPESCYAFGRNVRPAKKSAPQARAPGPKTKGVPRDPPSAHGASAPPPPHVSSGSVLQARASGENPVPPHPRSPSRGQGPLGRPGPLPGASPAPVSSKSPQSGSSSGLRPLRMGERSMRPSSLSPSRAPAAPCSSPMAPLASQAPGAPIAPGARGAPSSPPRAPKAPCVPMAAGARRGSRSPSRGRIAPVVSRDPGRRHSSPRSPGHALPDAHLGEWIEAAKVKQKRSAHDSVASVPTKNAFMVLDDGTEVLEADYESDFDRDTEMTDGNRDVTVGNVPGKVSMGSVQGSSTPFRGRVLPDSVGGNLRSGVTAPASS